MLALLVLFVSPVAAQTPAIKGSVADIQGASIRDAKVRVLDSITHAIVARAVTDQAGAFEVGVPPGDYMVTVTSVGFRLRIRPSVVVRERETTNLGELRLDIAGCDAPGVICDYFYTSSTQPPNPDPIKQAGVDLKLNCSLDTRTAAQSCPLSTDADFTLASDGNALYVKPLHGATIWYPDFPVRGCGHDGSEAQIRIDGLGGGMGFGLDFCVLRRDQFVSHVYLNRDVTANSTEAHFFFTTTRR